MAAVQLDLSLTVGSTSSQSPMVVEGRGTGQTPPADDPVRVWLPRNHSAFVFRRLRAELVARSWTKAASKPNPNQPMANGTCPLAGAIG